MATKAKVHRFKVWLKFMNEYRPDQDECYTYCGRIVVGARTNLALELKGTTCKDCKRYS